VACLLIYDGLKMHLYKNGSISRRDNRGPLSFSNWDKAYPLVVGTDAGGRSQWKGCIHELAIFDRALSPGEVQGSKGSGVQKKEQVQGFKQKAGSGVQGFRGSKERTGSRGDQEDKRPLIHYLFNTENTYKTMFRGKKAIGVRDLGKGEPADLVLPEQFAPYERVYLRWDLDWERISSNRVDVLINIIGFIPFGFLLTFAIAKKQCLSVLVPERLSVQRKCLSEKQQVPECLSEDKKEGIGLPASGVGIKEQGPGTRDKGVGTKDGFRLRDNNGEGIDKKRLAYMVFLTVVAGFVVSFAIEYLQAYLPSRDSSLRDLICNTVGTAMGAVAAALLLAKSNWEISNG
jgi:VanZ like family/Concanavalin A-like lectin/glucanases superfamily